MSRSATITDAFYAIQEPRRRRIIELLAETGSEQSVSYLVHVLGLPQPQVSKHLRVLREADLVRVRGDGPRRMYRLHGPALKPIHLWVKAFERFWDHQLDRIKMRAESLQSPATASSTHLPAADNSIDDHQQEHHQP